MRPQSAPPPDSPFREQRKGSKSRALGKALSGCHGRTGWKGPEWLWGRGGGWALTQMREAGAVLWPVRVDLDSGGKEGPSDVQRRISGVRRRVVPECGSSNGNDDLGGSGFSG